MESQLSTAAMSSYMHAPSAPVTKVCRFARFALLYLKSLRECLHREEADLSLNLRQCKCKVVKCLSLSCTLDFWQPGKV